MTDFDEFVIARGPSLVRFAYVLTADHHRAEDFVQNALVSLHGRWDHVSRLDNPDAYARRAVLNSFLSWRRAPSRWQRHAQLDEAMASHADTLGELATRDELWRLITALPRRERAALVLRFYEDLNDDEIALLMDCAVGTVRAHISRGVAKLRRQLAPETTRANR